VADETLSIDRVREGDRLVLHLRGELDMSTAAVVVDAATAAFSEAASVVVDLRGLTFIDSSGLNALVRIRRLTGESDGPPVTLRAPSDAIRKVLDITGLATYLEIAE